MLVFQRKQGETIVIDGRITITILPHRAGVTKVGIEAPTDIEVHRGEVYEAIHRDKATEVQS